jgi:hypothetical protein
MTGAIVVGDGEGAGNGAVVEVPAATGSTASPTGPSGSDETVETSPVGSTDPIDRSAMGWVGGAVIGLVVGLGVALFVTRRRRAPDAPVS